MNNFKGDFLNIWIFLLPQIPDFQIVVSQPNIVQSYQTIHQWKAYLFSFRIMYKSQFQKTDPYDWFVVHGSHMCEWLLTQHSEADDTDIAPPAVGQVVDQALVRPRVDSCVLLMKIEALVLGMVETKPTRPFMWLAKLKTCPPW